MVSGRIIAVAVCSAVGGALVYALLFGDDQQSNFARWKRWYSYDRHVANVTLTVIPVSEGCIEPALPIRVHIENGSSKTVSKVVFQLAAKRPGRSSSLVDGHQPLESDHIIAPGKTLSLCARQPVLKEKVDYPQTTLEWSIGLKIVGFQD